MHILDSHPLRGAFIANTLERLAALIVGQGDNLLRDANLTFPSRATSTVLLLGENARMSAAELAKALVQPHQLVTQRVDMLIELGIVSRDTDPQDARRKTLVLTSKGKREYGRLKAHLALADTAFAALFAEIGCDLAGAALLAIAALERSPLQERARALDKIDARTKNRRT